MNWTRNVSLAAVVALLVSVAGTAVLIAGSLEVHTPVEELPASKLAAMSDAELCQLEQHTLTGTAALRELGFGGLTGLYGDNWLILFLGVFAGCLAHRGLAQMVESRARPAA